MLEFVKRLYTERDELSLKIDKINKFLISDEFKMCNIKERNLLKHQRDAMSNYLYFLEARIDLYEGENNV